MTHLRQVLPSRYPVQIVTGGNNNDNVWIICNDGSMWMSFYQGQSWHRLPDVPQPENTND